MSPLKSFLRVIRCLSVGASIGAFIGAWNTAWLVLFLVANEKGWFYHGLGLTAKNLKYVQITSIAFLEYLSSKGIPLLGNLWGVVVLCVVCGLMLGIFLSALWALFRPDPGFLGLRCFGWGVRSFFTWSVLTLCAVVTGIVFLVAWKFETSWFALVVGIGFLLLFCWLPVAIVRESVLSEGRARSWWSFEWPGIRVLLWFLGLGFINFLLNTSLWFLGVFPTALAIVIIGPVGEPLTQMAIGFVASLVTMVFCLFQAGLLLTRDPRQVLPRRLFGWRIFGPWLSYHFWPWCFGFLLIGPIVAVAIFTVFIIPDIASLLKAQGLSFPSSWRVMIASYYGLKKYLWILSFSCEALYWFGAGRLAWVLLMKDDKLAGGDRTFVAVT